MRFVLWLVGNAVALAVAAWLIGGIRIAGATWQDRLPVLLVAALIVGVVSSVVGPVVKLLSLPLVILTIGLFLLVVNALMLLLAAQIADWLDLGFTVDGFWAAFWGSIVMTLVGWAVDAVLPDGDR